MNIMKTLAFMATIFTMAFPAMADQPGVTITPVPQQALAQSVTFTDDRLVVGVGNPAQDIDLGGSAHTAALNICRGEAGSQDFDVTIGSMKLRVQKHLSKPRTLVVGGLDTNCPLVFAPEDEAAADFVRRYFTDRFHDGVFFSEEDAKDMLAAVADGLKLTGPEWLDDFSVHEHDGDAFNRIFDERYANVMAYRVVTEDGRRAYLMVPDSCDEFCGLNFIFLHTSRPAPRQTTHTHSAPAPQPTPQPQPSARPAPNVIPMLCSTPNC